MVDDGFPSNIDDILLLLPPVRFLITSKGSIDIPILIFTDWLLGDKPINSSRSDHPVRKMSDGLLVGSKYPRSSKPDCRVGLTSICQYINAPDLGGNTLVPPGRKKNTNSFTADTGDKKSPGLVIVNVNFVLLDKGTGTKSVRIFAEATIKPKIGICDCGCGCGCGGGGAPDDGKLSLKLLNIDESRSISIFLLCFWFLLSVSSR
mmetsp:Transcript_44519/g.50269  ORF Transcript_44519/g.50269 Transcript_44519/m.50269 type:complete len:205 (+) Transcript_44519:365-979(+)